MVTIEGKQYQDTDPVPWDIAQRVGGFYFSRAEYLGLPPPPAAFAEADKMDDMWHTFG